MLIIRNNSYAYIPCNLSKEEEPYTLQIGDISKEVTDLLPDDNRYYKFDIEEFVLDKGEYKYSLNGRFNILSTGIIRFEAEMKTKEVVVNETYKSYDPTEYGYTEERWLT